MRRSRSRCATIRCCASIRTRPSATNIPNSYVRLFGADYKPEPYLDKAHEYCRNHKWYETARLLTVNDLYSFDPNLQVELEEFTDIVGRNFRQPEEGLGFDDSPSAHMWRTINWPTRYL